MSTAKKKTTFTKQAKNILAFLTRKGMHVSSKKILNSK